MASSGEVRQGPSRSPVRDRTGELLQGRPCIVCGAPLRPRFAEWSLQCQSCGSWASELVGGGREIESDVRIAGLEEVRRENFRVVLDRLEKLRPLRAASVLDVGSAYGWFVDEANRRGAQAEGIEPDEHVAARAIGPVRVG